ncbi:MAG: thiamine phosphate synthase [Geminicoccaceae bacterium]|nr:thiamine phosphate synthase [Geminicoccaceae bacterium]
MRSGRAGPASARGARDQPAGPWVEPGEVEPTLLLAAPDRLDADFADRLEAALAGGRVAAVLLDPAGCPAALRAELLAACLARCRAASVALFLEGDPAAVIEHAADGVLLRAVEAVEPARRLLGLERPIGVATGGSRHAAMEAGEAGADWLLLGEGLALERCAELVGWWSGLFVLPCAAPCASAEAARVLLAAGADFLIPPASIWGDPSAALAPFRAALTHPRG